MIGQYKNMVGGISRDMAGVSRADTGVSSDSSVFAECRQTWHIVQRHTSISLNHEYIILPSLVSFLNIGEHFVDKFI